jgi:hypothetical protein
MQSNAGNPLRKIDVLRDCTSGVLFLGTPHHGGDRGMLDITTKIMNANGQPTRRSTIKLLTEQLAKIDFEETHQLFRNMVGNQHKKGREIQVHSFLEQKGMPLFGHWRTWDLVCHNCKIGVDNLLISEQIIPESAATYDDKSFKGYLEKDHPGLTRFESPQDEAYILVRNIIVGVLSKSSMRFYTPIRLGLPNPMSHSSTC